jgi:hypothetical protein
MSIFIRMTLVFALLCVSSVIRAASHDELVEAAFVHFNQAELDDEFNLFKDELPQSTIDHLAKSREQLVDALKINRMSSVEFYLHFVCALLEPDARTAFEDLVSAKLAWEKQQNFYADDTPGHRLAQGLIRLAYFNMDRRLTAIGYVLDDVAKRLGEEFYSSVATYDGGNVAAGYLDYSTRGKEPEERLEALKLILDYCVVRDREILSRIVQEMARIEYDIHKNTQRESHIIDALELIERGILFASQAPLAPGSEYPDSLRYDREIFRLQYINWALETQDWIKAYDRLQIYVGETPELHKLPEYEEALMFANQAIYLAPNTQAAGGLTVDQEIYFEAFFIWKLMHSLGKDDLDMTREARGQTIAFYRSIGKDELADQLERMTPEQLKKHYLSRQS